MISGIEPWASARAGMNSAIGHSIRTFMTKIIVMKFFTDLLNRISRYCKK